MVNNIEIEYLAPKSEFRVGSVKNIAVPSNNKDDIKKMFPNSKKVESNADMLNQSFGAIPEITPIPNNDSNTLQVNQEPVQITAIPPVQNTDLEKNPVNLDMSVVTEIPTVEPIANEVPVINPIEPNIQSIEPIEQNKDIVTNDVELNTTPVMDNAFKVSSEPNIFDNPVSFNPIEVGNHSVETPGIHNQETEPKEKTEIYDNIPKADITDDVILAEIAIIESDIKHYEGLAQNNRKKIELLKKQIKKHENEVNLENTASNLFTNNGILDDEKVLGKTPMPNLRAA